MVVIEYILFLLLLLPAWQASEAIHARLENHGTARSIPKKSACSSQDDFQFDRAVSLTFQGWPNEISDADITMLQHAVIQAYNEAAACSNVEGGFLNLSNVHIMSLDSSNSLESTSIAVRGGNSHREQNFTLVASMLGACRGCRTSPFQVFQASSSSMQRSLAAGITSPAQVTTAANNKPVGRRLRAARNRCVCPVPTMSSFLVSFNSLMSSKERGPSSSPIDLLLDCTDMERQRSLQSCTAQKFQTFITVDFTKGSQNITNATIIRQQYDLLQKHVLGAFDYANMFLNYDPDYFIQNVTVVARPGTPGYGLTSMNRRQLLDKNTSGLFTSAITFSLTGGNFGCQTVPTLFHNDTVGQRRKLSPPHAEVADQLQEDAAQQSGSNGFKFSPTFGGKRSRRSSLGCMCDPTKIELPSKGKFLNGINFGSFDRFSIHIVGAAKGVFQDFPVKCSAKVNYFYDTVQLAVILASANVSSTVASQLALAFLSSYNSLTQSYCDPLFRTAESAQLVSAKVNQTASRLARSSLSGSHSSGGYVVNVILRVRGRCRGCKSSTTLYNDAVGKSRSSLPDSASTTNTNQGGHDRFLATQTACYCDANPVAFRAPTKSEFWNEAGQLIQGHISKISQDLKNP